MQLILSAGCPFNNHNKMDIILYTDNEIRKNLALLENHLKQSLFSDEIFCEECINKHILILEGLAEEGLTACIGCEIEKYKSLLNFLNQIKNKNYKEEGIEIAAASRELRKTFVPCGKQDRIRNKDEINKKIEELKEEKKLASDVRLKDKLDYGIYLLQWMLRGGRCSE